MRVYSQIEILQSLAGREAVPEKLRSFIKPLTTIQVMMAHASVASDKSQVELDSHTDTCLLVITV